MSSLNPSRSPLETLENESESAEPLLQTEISSSKATRKGAIDFDRVLQHVGPMGAWQLWHLFLLFWVPTVCLTEVVPKSGLPFLLIEYVIERV